MSTEPERTPPGISSDIIILLVFVFVGGLLFVSFVLNSINAAVPGMAALATSTRYSQLILTRTRTVEPSSTATITATVSRTPGTLVGILPTATPGLQNVPYRTSTPRRYNTVAAFKTITPTRTPTITRTPTKTPTITETGPTPTVTLTATITPTITHTPTITQTPTNTASPTPTLTPIPTSTLQSAVCLPALPVGDLIPPQYDTWIESGLPEAAHGSDPSLSVQTANLSQRRSLIYFDPLPASGTIISKANVYLYVSTSGPGMVINLYELLSSFDENATWIKTNGTDEWETPGGEFG